MGITQMSLVAREPSAWALGPAVSCQVLASWGKEWATPRGGAGRGGQREGVAVDSELPFLATQFLCQCGRSLPL